MSELLGTVTCPTGDLLLVDPGLLHLWSHDRAPLLEDGLLPDEVRERADGARDLEVVGPDAAAVAGALDLAAVKGRFAFDVPDGVDVVHDRVRELTAERGWRAEVREVDRMPHLRRTTTLLDEGPGGVEVPFHGGWAVAVRGLPTDRRLEVRAERVPEGPDAERWHSVWVQVQDTEPSTSVPAGYVLVDEARLMFADPTVLGAYDVRGSADGLADVVFWGRDDEAVAEVVGARRLDGEGFGWLDVPLAEADRLLDLLEAERGRGARFARDLRPHHDDHRLLAQARSAPTGAGSLDIRGGAVTGFSTSWGDGAFPVFCDLAADGSLSRVRVELGAPEIVERTRRFERLWFGDLSLLAVASTRVTRDGLSVGWLERDEPHDERDSGWVVYAGDESQAYLDDPDHASLVPLRELVQADPGLEAVLEAPAPCAFERDGDGWRRLRG